MNIFNRNGLSSRFCRSCLRWRACFTARSVNCCTVELSVSRCWIYHTNSFIGGVKQQLASTGRERNNLPLSNQMGSKQRCSPNSFSSPLVHVFSAALLSRGRGVRAVMQLHHHFFRLRIWLKKLTVKSLYWPCNIRAAVILLNFFPMRVVKHWKWGPEGMWGLHPWGYSGFTWTQSWAAWSNWGWAEQGCWTRDLQLAPSLLCHALALQFRPFRFGTAWLILDL